MKDLVKLVGVLLVICAVAGALLAAVSMITAEPIEAAARSEKLQAIETVLPKHTNAPDGETVTVKANDKTWTFYIARRDGTYVGTAVESVSSQGYGGDIAVMIGINTKNAIEAIEILQQKETPGLGAKIAEPAFKNAFAGKPLRGTRWAVRKDNGDIDQITAATISSRAVVDAVKQAIDVYLAHADTIRKGAPQ